MICPLQPRKDKENQQGQYVEHGWCQQEKCAWWFGTYGCCALVALGNILEELRHTISTRG